MSGTHKTDQAAGNAEQKMPREWTPENDADAEWSGLVSLMRESDKPVLPSEARYREIWRSVRQDADLPASLRRKRRAESDESFASWLRAMLLGGGLGGQAVRFAAVAAGVWVLAAGSPEMRPGPETLPAAETPPLADQVAAAADSVPARPAPPAGEGRFNSASANPELASAEMDWRALAGKQGWENAIYPVSNLTGFAPPNSMQVTRQQNQAANGSLSDLVNQLQQLKFESYLDSDRDALERIRRIENTVTRMMGTDGETAPDDVEVLERFQKAEELLAGRRYIDAILTFDQVRSLAPGTFLAFLAQYQIAGTSFSQLRDYDAALHAYRQTLEEYPAHFLTDDYKEHITSRIELLTRNRANNWHALDLWQDAKVALTTEERARLLKELMRTEPESPLAGEAAWALLDIAVDDRERTPLSPAELIRLCEDVLKEAPNGINAADVQFVKAEVVFRRLFDLAQAEKEFRKVLEMPGAEKLSERVQVRLNQITRRS